jgi:diguanylate cyclase (GGDEF)-like protein/PAS domain S-box-containing protein
MKGNSNKYKNIIENMPLAFAYHKVIYDEEGKAVDYIFLEVNKKFEELTGLKKEEIIDERVTNVLSDITKSEFNWIEFYGEVALTGATETVKKYSEPLDKWYKIKVYSDEKNHFTTIFSDITEDKKREQKIEKNKERYQTIFNSAPIGFMLENENGKIIEVNDIMCDDSGYSKSELEGSSILEKFVLPEYKELAKENIKRILKGKDLEFDVKTPTKEGNIKHYNLKETSITLSDGSKGIISMHLDITERKKLENELKEKNILLNSVLESIQDGIAVLNPDLTIRYTNPTMQKWFEDQAFLEGKKCFSGFYSKEDDCDNCPVIKSLKTGKMESTIKKMSADFEIDFIEIFSYPIYDQEKNKITGVVEFIKDISERLKQRKELEMMSFSINNADLLIFRVNSDGIIEYANETAFEQLSYNRDKLIGLKVENIISDDYYREREKYWDKLKSAGSLSYELSYLTTNKKYLPVEITSQYFKYQDKEYEFVFAQDITERLEKEKEIKYLAYKDSLTDLYNRKFFEAEMERLDTKRQLPISIIMGDLNGLKIINDSYGQDMGDELLIKTAEIFKGVVREDDILARYGGDEFTILLPRTTNKTAKKIVKRIKLKSREQNIGEISLSISLGTATKVEKNNKITEIIKIAEDNMNQNKLSESRSSKSNIVQGLLNTLNAKSSETKEHALRMTKLAFDFGEKLELSTSELNRLSLLATLHDIGKTSIAEDILKKPGRLTDAEWELIKEHPERGYKIASASEEFALVADPILAHHEKWDGSGYPSKLKGKDIPYLARIITIIDSYDVMTNDRPYSKAMFQEEALAEIKSCAGSQFDPELAEKFIELINSFNS